VAREDREDVVRRGPRLAARLREDHSVTLRCRLLFLWGLSLQATTG
jgi:hypothetical protein